MRRGGKPRQRRSAAAAVLVLAGLAMPVRSQPPRLRQAEHPGFGRLVLQLPGRWHYSSRRQGDNVTITVTTGDGSPLALPGSPQPPHDFAAVTGGANQLHVKLKPGEKLSVRQLGGRLVIDAFDPAVKPAGLETPRRGTPDQTSPAPSPALPPAPSVPSSAPPPAQTQTEPPAQPDPGIAVTRVDVPGGLAGNALLVPFQVNVGAAAFARGSSEVIVFDQASPLDLAQIAQDPVFGGGSVTMLEDATVLRLPRPATGALRLIRVEDGWLVLQEDTPSVISAIEPEGRDQQLHLPATGALRSITIPDPMTGENLLIGTQRNAGQGVLADRYAPEYHVLASDLGVAIEPKSDRLHLIAQDSGFMLGVTGRGPPLNLPVDTAPAMANAAGLRRHYEFADEPIQALWRELQGEMLTAAQSPPLSRFEPRMKVAQTMLELGLDVESEAVMNLAITSDASQSGNPDAKGLEAMAATLAGRLDETAALDDPRLGQWDDVKLWRALRDAQKNHGSPQAAQALVPVSPLLLTYPKPLRDRLIPLAIETMALGGQLDGARALAAHDQGDPAIALGLAIIDEKRGNAEAALREYDVIAAGRDRSAAAWAAQRAVELRLAQGKLTPAEAATAFERQFLNWRGDGRELALRERAAQLRVQSHDWRAALALLREAQVVYPDAADELHEQMANTLEDMLKNNGASSLSPFDLVELADENADIIASSSQADQLEAMLADRLIDLDLPSRAAPVLQKLMQAASPGIGQAKLGAKLAAVQLDQNQPQAAITALNASAVPNLPAGLTIERAMAMARAQAWLGQSATAAQILTPLSNPAADDLRAQIDEAAKNWQDAEAALSDLATLQIPATGDLTDAQRDILLRLAAAAAQNNDSVKLTSLRPQQSRMGSGDRADLFRLLLAQPVKGLADLGRARSEDQLVGAVPAAVSKLQ